MQIIVLNKVEEGIQPPTGNGFPVFVNNHKDVFMGGVLGLQSFTVDTGLNISLPKGFTIEVESLIGFQMDWSLAGMEVGRGNGEKEYIPEGRILLKSYNTSIEINKFREEGKPIAKIWIVKRQVEKIRFMEMAKDGGRVIRGDGKVVNSVETGSIKPGE